MDTALKFEAWRESIKRTLPRESKLFKIIVMLGGLLTFVATLTLGIYQMQMWSNALVIQNNFNNTAVWNKTIFENSTYYDIQFINGTYVNDTEATNLKLTINATCDYDCQAKGCRWSVSYALAGFVLVLTAANAILLVFGSFFYSVRMVGMCCHYCLTGASLISFIISFKFRYQDQGKLAAMSTMPSKTVSTTEYDPNWTYQDDAHLITKLLWAQGVVLVVCLVAASIGCCAPSKKQNMRNTATIVRASEAQQDEPAYREVP